MAAPIDLEERRRVSGNPYRPAENVMLAQPIGLNDLGIKFNVNAPFRCCRLCGAIYQSSDDRLCRSYLEEGTLVEHKSITNRICFTGPQSALTLIDIANAKRERWAKLHERRYHTESETIALQKSGFAFTPEAANKLAPYGITPLGNLHPEIADALYEAPRKPFDDVEE